MVCSSGEAGEIDKEDRDDLSFLTRLRCPELIATGVAEARTCGILLAAARAGFHDPKRTTHAIGSGPADVNLSRGSGLATRHRPTVRATKVRRLLVLGGHANASKSTTRRISSSTACRSDSASAVAD